MPPAPSAAPPDPPPRGTFILGVGAQKAGTTWLYKYLDRFDCVDLGMMKEYHIWDVRQDPQMFRRFRVDEAALFRHRDKPRFPRLKLRYAMQNIDGFYGFYFQSLLDAPGRTITGDITPSYCALSVPALREIRKLLEARGFAVKVVFLMRDPVERIWSAVRMERRIAAHNGADAAALGCEVAQVAQSYATPAIRVRTAYHETITRLEQVFAPREIFYGFHEELFTPPGLRRVAEFLEVPYCPEQMAQQVNVTPKTTALPAALRQQIRDHYAPVYRFCAARFPCTERLWEAGSAL